MLRIPLAVGTVGGLTSTHPLVGISFKILGYPSARELMQIVASVGLASNFSAIRALITSGIQKGHMNLHLNNALHQLMANEMETLAVKQYVKNKTVSFVEVETFIKKLRS